MTFLYFAYGSNTWLPRLISRCPSARLIGQAHLDGYQALYDKPSIDGSSKLNIRPAASERVHGVVFEIDADEQTLLDNAEPLYRPIEVETSLGSCRTYSYEGEPFNQLPYDWYVATVTLGLGSHGAPSAAAESASNPDPRVGPLRLAGVADHDLIRSILSEGLTSDSDRYYAHPGDFSWWVHHPDPRYEDQLSTWLWADKGFAFLNSREPREINLFTRPGVDRQPFVEWCRQWLGGVAELGWIDDADPLADELAAAGASVESTFTQFEWDLTTDISNPELPPGWSLRHLAGEDEANSRREASHRAFQSTMPDDLHLNRYLRFMRSVAYVPENDLVAVDENGRVGAFMVWWADPSGVAEIEPFGTHPEFQRMGLGRALLRFGAQRAREAGMHTLRVGTYEDWPAAEFYSQSGFDRVGSLRWWKIGS